MQNRKLGIFSAVGAVVACTSGEGITETTRTHLVLFDVQNRKFGPYLPTINRILISPTTGERGVIAGVSAICVMTITMPLEVVMRRLQVLK
jgi:hypothetical protein